MLCCHSYDVVQGIHLAQHLHNVLDLLPVVRHDMHYEHYGKYSSQQFKSTHCEKVIINLIKQP